MTEHRTPAPRKMMTHLERLRDEGGFVHKSVVGRFVGGIVKGAISHVPIVGGVAGSLIDRFTGGGVPGVITGAPGTSAIPGGQGCPPGFLRGPGGTCRPVSSAPSAFGEPLPGQFFQNGRGAPAPFVGARQNGAFVPPTPVQARERERLGLLADPAAGVAVMGRFGAGFEPEVFMRDSRSCGRRGVLGADGICYNKGDLRNSDRWWPRGRRPLLTGGEMRAISTASSAAKKLQRKQKQLESLGLLKKAAPRTRRALPAGHTAELRH